MTKDEALKMARTALGVQLDALLGKAGHLRNDDRRRYAENGIKAIDEALAQPEPWEKFCDSNCVWTDHHPDCKLAQPEQKPVAWRTYTGRGYYIIDATLEEAQKNWPDRQHRPLYTSPPPQRKPLTDEEIGAIMEDLNAYGTRLYTFARAIEAKLKEKNT